MKKIFILAAALLLISHFAESQKIYATRNGKIIFESPTDSDVKATNNEVTSRIADNGQITFSLLMKGFKFKYAEMQEHFNDQYIQSVTYPRADFKGTIINLKDVNFTKNGTYKVTVKGDLTMHGVTKSISANGTLEVAAEKIIAKAVFPIMMKDFKIDASSVTEKVNIDLSCQYQ